MGPLTLEFDGADVPVAGRQPRVVLALLLVNQGRPLTAEQLIDGLWPSEQPASARSMVHMSLSKVRAQLGDVLVRSRAGYGLRAGSYELDLDRFDQLLDQARQQPARAGDLLTEALGLWRGEPLSDLQPDGPLADWSRSLQERRLRATEMRIDHDLAAGAAADLLPELEQLVSTSPYEEPFWRQLMLALYRAGRQADALSAYDRVRRRLVTELGLNPGEQLTRLHQQILAQDPVLLHAPAAGAPPATAPAPRRSRTRHMALPAPTTRLIGRDVALLELERLVSDPFCRLVTLTGLGGVGKTRLAIAHAARWGESFADGVVFAGLAHLTDPRQVRAEIASAIARRSAASEPNELTLVRYVADRDLLLVLDNFEHVLDAVGVVAELLEGSPALKVLVTSRVPLRLRGEQRFEVAPLAAHSDEDPAGGPAVELFLHGAAAVDRAFTPSATELATIAGICSALDGLPLAIELAAARSSVLSMAQIATQLDAPLSIGRGTLRDLPDRHQTLEAAIRWSYELLPTAAQQALRAAAAFVGPFTPEGFKAVSGGDSAGALDELVDASLVQRSSVPGRFRLLDLVRTYALARLSQAGEEEEARTRHRHYLLTQFGHVAAEEFPSTPGQVALEMAGDHADIRMAISTAVATGDGETAVTLAKALHSLWWVGQLEESGATVDSILNAFTLAPEDELRLLRIADDANGYRPSNDYWSRRRAGRAAELGDVRNQVGAMGRLVVHAMNRRDLAAAIDVCADLARVLEENPELNPRSRGIALTAMADCAYLQGDYARSVALCAQAVDLALAGGLVQSITVRRQLQLLATSAHEGAIAPGAVLAVVEGALTLGLRDVGVNSLLAAARYAAGIDAELARLWLANAERVLIELGGELGHDWQDETLAILEVADIATVLDSVPVRPIFDLLAEARDWLRARDPDERAPRTVLAAPLPAIRPGTAVQP